MNQSQNNRRNYLNGRVKAVATIALLIAAVLVSGFVWANSRVIIRVDGKTMNVNANALDPKEVLSQAGVYLGPRDEFRVVANEPGSSSVIEVFRAIPVTLSDGAKIDVVWTGKPTVGEIAESRGYPARSFKTIPDAATRPTANMEIRILTLSDKVMEKELPVPFPIVRHPDPTWKKAWKSWWSMECQEKNWRRYGKCLKMAGRPVSTF